MILVILLLIYNLHLHNTIKMQVLDMSIELAEFFQSDNIQLDILEPEYENPRLNEFFEGVKPSDMFDYFRSFECGETWVSNPIFSDEFTENNLPYRLQSILHELNEVLDIKRSIQAKWIGQDYRYSSLCEYQQDQVRKTVHRDLNKVDQLCDICNRIVAIGLNNQGAEIQFILNAILDVIQDVLCKI